MCAKKREKKKKKKKKREKKSEVFRRLRNEKEKTQGSVSNLIRKQVSF